MTAVWYKRYPSDFLNGVAELSAEERGIYTTLLDMMYDQGGSIADNAKPLARRCGCSTRRFNAVRTRLLSEEKLFTFEGRLFNRRVFKSLKSQFISDLSLKYLVLIFPEWRKFKGLADTKTLDSRLHKKINKKRIKRVGTECPAPEPDELLVQAPMEATPERELFDLVCTVYGPEVWQGWFTEAQISIEGNVLVPKTRFVRSKISQNYGDIVVAAGLTLGEVR